MEIAILGATSQIAKDLIRSLSSRSDLKLKLFARRTDAVASWLRQSNLEGRHQVGDYHQFADSTIEFDAVINFVGSGNPARTASMGSSILAVSNQYDELALTYLLKQPACKYIHFSSGAVYGSGFHAPATDTTPAQFCVNSLQSSDWYGLAKFYAECKHRALDQFSIIDIRLFSYFSYSADISARFLITDMLRAVISNDVFRTSKTNIYRDVAGPEQIAALVGCILSAAHINAAIDCYTKRPIDKMSLIEAMHTELGMSYEFVEEQMGLNATGNKPHYYSTSTKANDLFGYEPADTSLNIVLQQAHNLLKT